jgi:hypothetical protein
MTKPTGNNPGPRITDVKLEWMPLVLAAGSKTRLAKKLAVSLSTLHRWSCLGRGVSPIAKRGVRALCSELGVKAPF